MIRPTLILALALVPGVAHEAVAQRQALTPETQKVPLAASLLIGGTVAGKGIQASGGGTCRHAPDASIQGVSASLWTVKYGGSDDGEVKQLNLTLWRPKDGSPDRLSLLLETQSGEHRIETGKGKHKGQGSVTILPSGPGGRLELLGKDHKGKPLKFSIDCPSFEEVAADGG